ncbi:MAG: RNA 2',3'-cyclic phosphodiesterase [Geobacteraceae bacterium]|nr:RNA 2',3'-cyclic phosphodiesterase [Geobacteraceae bacterium]
MRLFVAIDLPEEVKNGVAGLCGGLPEARWVPMEQFHLTLRFIGEVDEAGFRAIKVALAGVQAPPFPLALKGIGHFPPGRHPRVLWVGLEGSAPLLELQQEVELALVSAAIPPEERKFSPHITLARLKETPAEKVLALEQRQGEFASTPFPVTEFHLYSSTLTREGAIHTREASYPLLPEGR